MRFRDTIIGLVLFIALFAGAGYIYLTYFSPNPPEEDVTAARDYNLAPMREAMSGESIARLRDSIREKGSRLLGQPGFYATAVLIREHYEAAGLEILELEDRALSPLTRLREVHNDRGERLPVEVYPFMPNNFQPIFTPAEGVSGELVLINNDSLLNRNSFAGVIGLVDADDIPTAYGTDWTRYAQLGLAGLILASPEGLEELNWSTVIGSGRMVSPLPVNFPRLAADAGIFDYLGQTITLHVQVDLNPVPHTTLIGIKRAARPARDAVVITTAYDGYSILPDKAGNAAQATILAQFLGLVDGVADYDSFSRDVIFVATGTQMMGSLSDNTLLSMIGTSLGRSSFVSVIDRNIREHTANLKAIEAVLPVIEQSAFLIDEASTLAGVDKLSDSDSNLLLEQLRFVINSQVLELSREVLERKIAFERGDVNNLSRPEYEAYITLRRTYEELVTAAGLRLGPLMILKSRETGERVVDRFDVPTALRQRFERLQRYHEQQLAFYRQGRAIHDTFRAYNNINAIYPAFLPDGTKNPGRLAFVLGDARPIVRLDTQFRSQGPRISRLLEGVIQQSSLETVPSFRSSVGLAQGPFYNQVAFMPSPTGVWNNYEYPSFTLFNFDRRRSYLQLSQPVDNPSMLELASIEPSLGIMGELLLAMGHGEGRLATPPRARLGNYSGRVYVANVGRSIVPNFPLADAIVGNKVTSANMAQAPGRYYVPLLSTNPYGNYALLNSGITFVGSAPLSYNPQAFRIDPNDGNIYLIKDEGASIQNLYRSVNLPFFNPENLRNINLVTFLATSVTILDQINPQNLRPFTGIELVNSRTLTPFNQINTTLTDTSDGSTTFIAPDHYFYIKFRAGSPDNELVQTVRAFMLGAEDEGRSSESEISGTGYLAADSALIVDVSFETAESMIRVNERRLELQRRTNLADRYTVEFHERGVDLIDSARQPDISQYEAVQSARDAVTYSIISHPVLRQNINHAVISILWYLGLLVPFAFFFEKLVFGFNDIRKQLAAQSVIFLIVFVLLRILHPAFELIRSSFMILLGFVIILIATGITLLFAGKFRENLEGLKRRRGQVSAAEINTMGVIGTAFMLGLNNMHRRKVRTGLTCATLVLITFAMICFTSIYSDFKDDETALGRAPYQGFLIKNEKVRPLAASEEFSLRTKYAYDHDVAARHFWVGHQDNLRVKTNPDFNASITDSEGITRSVDFTSVLHFGHNEPLRNSIPLITGRYWFPDPATMSGATVFPVIISDVMAGQLGIRPEMIDAGDEVLVRINGEDFQVKGIFDSERMEVLRDVDGRSVLPFNIMGIAEPEQIGGPTGPILADDDAPLMRAEDVVIMPGYVSQLSAEGGQRRMVSLVVGLDDLPYREAREIIMQFLEQSGRPTFYGIDGTAYRGSRLRESSLEGMIDLLIPLLIAAMTVLNTMRGSVYERKDEIFVYNAVGIAPRFIFFMFFAEAFVYAVVGCVLGYLLSQGTGRILTIMDLTGGLNMTFASLNSIYASLAVVAAVFVSTFFPARSAMQIAAPAEDSGWKLPEPEGDELAFNLPFTFDTADRVAILAFFDRFLVDHGEGSAGTFLASPPYFDVEGPPEGSAHEIIPEIIATIWLKPYDLGVSQLMTISIPLDPETGEYIARIKLTRKSGTQESWRRVNHHFVMQIRKQFLHWRAVTPDQKKELFAEARQRLESSLQTREVTHG
jgi:hypothetical protein